jgi:hypothetical protein
MFDFIEEGIRNETAIKEENLTNSKYISFEDYRSQRQKIILFKKIVFLVIIIITSILTGYILGHYIF